MLKKVMYQLPASGELAYYSNPNMVESLEMATELVRLSERSASFFGEDKELIGCVGYMRHMQHRVEMWSALSKNSGPYMLSLTRMGHRFLKDIDAERIECFVKYGYTLGNRWAELLGFKKEAVLRSITPKTDYTVYSIIKEI